MDKIKDINLIKILDNELARNNFNRSSINKDGILAVFHNNKKIWEGSILKAIDYFKLMPTFKN